MALVSKLTRVGDHFISGEYDEVNKPASPTVSKQYSNGNLSILGSFDEYTNYQDYLRYYSVLLNGTNQYINTGIGTTTSTVFTVECHLYLTSWLRSTGAGGYIGVIYGGNAGNAPWFVLSGNASSITGIFHAAVGSAAADKGWGISGGLQLNTWYHIALSRNGSTWAVWINGVKLSNPGDTGPSYVFASGTMTIGVNINNPGYAGYIPGYISNFKVVSGSTTYNPTSTTITVPTTPYRNPLTTYYLYQCAASTVSGGVNGPTASTFIPFSPKSLNQYNNGNLNIIGKFDEYTLANGIYSIPFTGVSGEYLTIPSGVLMFGTGNFTVEAWITTTAYNASGSGGEVIIDNYMSQTSGSYVPGQWTLWINTSGQLVFNYASTASLVASIIGGTVPAYSWNHVAVVRSGTTITLYINGAASTSATYAGTIGATGTSYIGGQAAGSGLTYRFAGTISNLRVLNSTALYTSSFTTPTLPMIPNANTTLLTCQLPIVEDNSPNRYTITNPASLTPTLVPNKSYRVFFNGAAINSNLNATAGSSRYNIFGATASTVEFWYCQTGTRVGHLLVVGNGNQDRVYVISSSTTLSVGSAVGGSFFTRITSGVPVVLNKWTHVALTRVGSTVSLYVNGIFQGSSSAQFYSAATVTVTLGTQPYAGGSSNDWYIGLMSNFRMLNGTALYTSDFTPPQEPLTAITNTVLLTMNSPTIVDNSGYGATINNPQSLVQYAPLI